MNVYGAVIATRPESIPFALIEGSGRPYLRHVTRKARSAPEADASIVFVATTEILRSVPASVEPALKPNQPNARMKQPRIAIGRLCPGIARASPRTSLPVRGPRTHAPVNAPAPPVRWTTPEPAKST